MISSSHVSSLSAVALMMMMVVLVQLKNLFEFLLVDGYE